MIHVNLDIDERFYSTFKKIICGFKDEIKLVEAYDEIHLQKTISQAVKDYEEGNTSEIKDIDIHINKLFM
tara:strand:+ start:502 stop:711 length:210 start_codon:yes stop_codon:yes gene_type:complete